MHVHTKLAIVLGFKLLFASLGFWYWHRYTQRGAFALIGVLTLACMLGAMIGLMITLPFPTHGFGASELNINIQEIPQNEVVAE